MKLSPRLAVLVILLLGSLCITYVFAVPDTATITAISNSTKSTGAGGLVNLTGNDTTYTEKAGGFIYTITLSATSQNQRWKGFVGNVSGTLVLDDATGSTLYEWSTSSAALSGEIYATRAASIISWTTINCSDIGNISKEETAMNHTNNPDDNISATFDTKDNQEFYVGSIKINESTCYTTNTYVDSSSPGSDNFEEILLSDGSNLIYAVPLEQDADGYQNNDVTYDFQMIVPERGLSGWVSSTAYYFYVELS